MQQPTDESALVALIEEQRQAIAELRARVEELESMPTNTLDHRGPVSRRALFGLAGAGLAGLVAVDAAPAAAANGDPLLLGQTNEATSSTTLQSTAYPGLKVDSDGEVAIEANGLFSGLVGTADADGGRGVVGIAPQNGHGVVGGADGPGRGGVAGYATEQFGVHGYATSGWGVSCQSETGPNLWLNLPAKARSGPPPDSNWAGSVSTDDDGALWYCTTTGDPGTWTRLNQQTTLFDAPQRAYDSRTTGGKFANAQTRTIDLTADTDLPDNARIAIVTLSVTATTGSGFASIYSAASPVLNPPEFATITWSSTGQTISNAATVAVSNGQIRVYSHRSSHLIIDVVGHHA